MSNKIWPCKQKQHMNSLHVENLCHMSDHWSWSSFYEFKWNLDRSHSAPVENISGATAATKKLQHTSLTMTTSDTATTLPLTPKLPLQHKFNCNCPHHHITCDDTAAWLCPICSFLEEMVPFLPCCICYEMNVMIRYRGKGSLWMTSWFQYQLSPSQPTAYA
jgi:hypothetical protein